MKIKQGLKAHYKKFIILAIILGVGFLIVKSMMGGGSKKVDTTTVKRGDLKEELVLSGQVDAREKVTLRFASSGKLSWVGVKEGDTVKKYQVIATQDSRELKKNLQKYLLSYMNERWDFDQTKENYKDTAMSNAIQRVLDKSQFDLNSTILDVELKNIAIEYSRLWSPIDGVVTKVDVPVAGTYITPTQAEFSVVNLDTLMFQVTADQSEVVRLENGKAGELALDAFTGEKIPVSITNISYLPNTKETGTVYDVKLSFSSPSAQLRLGMTGDVTFVMQEKKDVLYIPQKFVKTQNGNKYVDIERNGKKERVTVKVGLEADSNVEILEGLAQGETVSD